MVILFIMRKLDLGCLVLSDCKPIWAH